AVDPRPRSSSAGLGAGGRTIEVLRSRCSPRMRRAGGERVGGAPLASNFRVTIRLERTAIVMVLRGELDLASFPQLEHALDRALESDPELVVLDFEELDFMDIAGLRSVIRSAQRLSGLGKRLVIAGPRGGVKRVIELTHQQDALDFAA